MSLLDWIYPPKCISCRTIQMPAHNIPQPYNKWLCEECVPIFVPIHEPFCPRCGHPLEAVGTVCPSCKDKKFYFSNHRAAFVYEDTVRDIIHRIKFHSQKDGAFGLGYLFSTISADWDIEADYIVPIPLHYAKKRTRGFNQAALLAKPFAKIRGIPLAEDMLLRIKKTAPQSGLSAIAREHNLLGSFKFNGKKYSVVGKKIILADDIFTTGTTFNACAKILLEQGATEVSGLSLSITRYNF